MFGKRPKQSKASAKPKARQAGPRTPADRGALPARGMAAGGADLRDRLLQITSSAGYQPLTASQLSAKLGLAGGEAEEFTALLAECEAEGLLARVRDDRFVPPQMAQLQVGRIHFHERGFAWVISAAGDQPDLFIPAEQTGVAMHNDIVVARFQQKRGFRGGKAEARADQREGRVVRILRRARGTITGTLRRTNRFEFVTPDDPRLVHDIYVQHNPAANAGDKVLVRLDEWLSPHNAPEGEILDVFGRADDPSIWGDVIVRKYGLTQEFPPEAVEEAGRALPPEWREGEGREDCRDTMVITVDPDDARDFDDAIFVEKLRSGWKAAIHIADVSHYVVEGGALDLEAQRRGNSVYLVDRVVPMLPEVLSNGLCSLRPDEDRNAFTVFLDFDGEGVVRKTRFARTLIRSAARLTYREALERLQRPPKDPIGIRLHAAWSLSKVLREKRFKKGSLELDFPEVSVKLDADGRPRAMERSENDISHQLIEELMLAANEAAARHLRRLGIPAIYRVHDKPDPDKLLEFREILAQHGISVGDLSQPSEIQKMMRAIRGRSEEHALKVAFLRSLKRATYDTAPTGHYGLAKADYLHFTSPIRRYADLVAHRALAAALAGRANAQNHRLLRPVAKHISETERNAAEAEREHKTMLQVEYFRMREGTGEVFDAVVMDVRAQGLFVELPNELFSGLIPTSGMGDEFFRYDPARHCFVGTRSKQTYSLGARLRVRVDRVDTVRRRVDFKIAATISEGKPAVATRQVAEKRPAPANPPASSKRQTATKRPGTTKSKGALSRKKRR